MATQLDAAVADSSGFRASGGSLLDRISSAAGPSQAPSQSGSISKKTNGQPPKKKGKQKQAVPPVEEEEFLTPWYPFKSQLPPSVSRMERCATRFFIGR